MPSSPGLRRRRYPGSTATDSNNPNGVATSYAALATPCEADESTAAACRDFFAFFRSACSRRATLLSAFSISLATPLRNTRTPTPDAAAEMSVCHPSISPYHSATAYRLLADSIAANDRLSPLPRGTTGGSAELYQSERGAAATRPIRAGSASDRSGRARLPPTRIPGDPTRP